MFVKGKAENFFVAGRSLPLYIVAVTLASQSIDSNALLANADFAFKFHFFDGAVIPIGLGLSLVLNAIFLAGKINREGVLTLPDIFAKRYGRTVETLVSVATIVSFLFLLAGNLVGIGAVLSYILDISPSAAVWIATVVVWAYTVSGGLFSVAYTDLVQGLFGWLGCLACAFWFIHNVNPGAAPPSRGFQGYVYPDGLGDGGVCDAYNGVSCTFNSSLCCFGASNQTDNGAFPVGDQRVFGNQMFSPTALTPFPNALLWNWSTIFILAFGNLAALDFQARCMASRTPRVATLGCLIAGCLTFLVGIPFSYLGAITRTLLGLATCAQWEPDERAFLQLLTQRAPAVLGGWCLIGLVAASMSTSDGAILAMGTVFSHNLLRQASHWFPRAFSRERLLLLARLSTLPFAIIAGAIGSYSAKITGTLLIVAFDVVLATVVAPLFGCFYTANPSPRAALLSFATGSVLRISLQFALRKDGSFLLPYSAREFLDFGPAASLRLPLFVDDAADNVWDPALEICAQERFRDYSGVDSLTAFAASIIVFAGVQMIEHYTATPFFRFPGDVPYNKDSRCQEGEVDTEDAHRSVEVQDESTII
ncbi:Sodium/glucose symporter [Gracilaria domingensis]|nr:Sodium/glucose symporter [Gracilaria domingensis]